MRCRWYLKLTPVGQSKVTFLKLHRNMLASYFEQQLQQQKQKNENNFIRQI